MFAFNIVFQRHVTTSICISMLDCFILARKPPAGKHLAWEAILLRAVVSVRLGSCLVWEDSGWGAGRASGTLAYPCPRSGPSVMYGMICFRCVA